MKSKKKKLIVIILIVAIAVAVALKLFVFNGKEKAPEEPSPIDPPREYTLGETSVLALPVLGDGVTVYLEPKAPSDTEESGTEESVEVTYLYEGLADSAALAEGYTRLMTSEDAGFFAVDEELLETDEPDFEQPEGAVHLVRSAPEEGHYLSIQLSWARGSCTVTADMPAGSLPEPPAPVEMTVAEATQYMRAHLPSVLGVDAATAESYNIYAEDGKAIINGMPCIRFKVCQEDDLTGSNENAGDFYLSADQRHIYRLDLDNNTVVEVSAP